MKPSPRGSHSNKKKVNFNALCVQKFAFAQRRRSAGKAHTTAKTDENLQTVFRLYVMCMIGEMRLVQCNSWASTSDKKNKKK